MHKSKNFWKNLLENKEIVFKNGVKKVQAVAYNGALPSTNSAILTKYPTFEAVFACFHGQKNKNNHSF